MGFSPPLKDCVRIAVQGAADAAGGLLRIALGTPGERVWNAGLGRFLETGAMWADDNPIALLVAAGFDGLETCLIDGYGEPGGGGPGPGAEADHFLATNADSVVLYKGTLVRLSDDSQIVRASLSGPGEGDLAGVTESDIAVGVPGYVRPQGVVDCLLEAGLSPDPAGGDRLFLSASDGLGTHISGRFDLGLIVDGSSYVGATPADSLVRVVLRAAPYDLGA